jgi:RimJ/RimL family protein N-acetyltransferase
MRAARASRSTFATHAVVNVDRVVIETDRLRLRELRSGDLDALAAMFADPEQMRFYARPRTHDEAAQWLDRHLAMYDQLGFGLWAIELKSSVCFAGYCGIRPLKLGGDAATEVAWRVEKTHWKQGLATEAATSVRDLANRRLTALIPPDHQASRRVAEKIGMQQERTTMVDGDLTAIYVWKP